MNFYNRAVTSIISGFGGTFLALSFIFYRLDWLPIDAVMRTIFICSSGFISFIVYINLPKNRR